MDTRDTKNTTESICLIVNPRAGAGTAGSRLGELRRAAEAAFAKCEIRPTTSQGHATELAARAVADGFDIVAAVGGDGTCNEVVNGLFDGDKMRSPKVVFTVVPFGTGSDLIKSLKIPNNLREALWTASTGLTLPTDAGITRFTTDAGEAERIFLNVAGFGANGEVVQAANNMDKRWGGRVTFLRASVQTALRYKPPLMALTWFEEGEERRLESNVMSCFVANGFYCGGGMHVGSGGSMQDGAFEVTLLPKSGTVRQLADARHLYDGRIEETKGATRFRTARLRAEVPEGEVVLIDADGEMPGRLPATFRVLPKALQVRGGWLKNPHLGT